jgi:hypothetical protein
MRHYEVIRADELELEEFKHEIFTVRYQMVSSQSV